MKQLLFSLVLLFCFTSCDDNNTNSSETVERTLFMYLPWSGNSTPSGGIYNLLSYFKVNIEDIQTAIMENGLQSERVLVFISTSPTEAMLFEIKYERGRCFHQLYKSYSNIPFTTTAGISSVLKEVISIAPAKTYGMIIGAHGMGWLPVSSGASRTISDQKMHWQYEDAMLTRYFGGTEAQYQTDITTLAAAIAQAGVKMEFILFDDCYLSTVEVAYDLKDVTDYIIACPTEIMAYGMPYSQIGRYLLGNPNYQEIVDTFYEFYIAYGNFPHGTIAVVKCSEIDAMVTLMKEINRQFTFDTQLRSSIQRMDGYIPVIFFDYADYVAKLINNRDVDLLNRFNAQLERTVPYKSHTPSFYSASSGAIRINTYSGITISDPSTNSLAAQKTETGWYKATEAK